MKTKARPHSSVGRVHTFVASLPLLVILICYSCVLHARLWLGHWPGPTNRSPVTFASPWYELHELAAAVSVFILAGSPLLWLCLLPLADRAMTLRGYVPRLALFLAGLTAVAVLVWNDPGGMVVWFLD